MCRRCIAGVSLVYFNLLASILQLPGMQAIECAFFDIHLEGDRVANDFHSNTVKFQLFLPLRSGGLKNGFCKLISYIQCEIIQAKFVSRVSSNICINTLSPMNRTQKKLDPRCNREETLSPCMVSSAHLLFSFQPWTMVSNIGEVTGYILKPKTRLDESTKQGSNGKTI